MGDALAPPVVRAVNVGGVELSLVEHQGGKRTLLRPLGVALALRRSTRYRLEAQMRASWSIEPWRVEYPDGRRSIEQTLPLEWLDAYLWRLRDPVSEERRGRLMTLRMGWRQTLQEKIPVFEALSFAAEGELRAARRHAAALEAELAARRDRAERLRERNRRNALGPVAFQAIRAATEDQALAVAQGFGISPHTARQIRAGSYRSDAFRQWLSANGIQPATARASAGERRANDSWPGGPPDWVRQLAQACDSCGQRAVARQLGLSAATVNLVLGARYPGRLDQVERRVRSELMS